MPHETRAPGERLVVLLNPSAGGGRAAAGKAGLVRLLEAHDIPHDLFITESEAHLRELTRENCRGAGVLAGAGGDSTFQIMAEEIVRAGGRAELGLIGFGSSNDIPLEFGVETPEKFVAAFKEGRRRRIDLGCVESEGRALKLFIGQASLGLGAVVNQFAARIGARHPLLARRQTAVGLWGVARAYVRGLVPVPLRVESDEGQAEGFFEVANFSNIRFWATGRLLVPQARVDDGKLDACLIRRCSFFRLARLTAAVRSGRHLGEREVVSFQSAAFAVSSEKPFAVQVDGELIGGADCPSFFRRLSVRVIPAALTVVA
jgi:diacylglycerol kinase (ATP)